jgi:hypothetical protein
MDNQDKVADWLEQLLQIAFVVLAILNIQHHAGRHIDYIHYIMTSSETAFTETIDFFAHLIYTSALFVCRLSGLAFYQRLCELHDKLSLAIKLTAGFLIAAYIPQMFIIIFHCSPVTSLWPYSFQDHVLMYKCLTWGEVYLINSTLSLACDFFMFAIPMVFIHSLMLPLPKRIRLFLVLFPGVV